MSSRGSGADADAGCTGHPEVWAAQLRQASPSPCEGPVHRGLLCGPRQVGGTQLALGHATGWGGQRVPLLCVLRAWVLPVVWNRSARCPLLEGPARVPLCLSQRPPALNGLGGRDVQGWARKERPTAGSRFAPGCLMTGDPCYGNRQEDGGGALPRPPTPSDPFLDRLSRPRAQPLRTPRLGLEEPQVGSTPSTGAAATGGTRTQPTTEPCLLDTQERSASI